MLCLRPLRLASALGLLTVVTFGCKDPEMDTATTTATEMTNPTTDSDSDSATTNPGTDSDDTLGTDSEGETTGVEFVPIPARGITLDRVQANQGVGIDIAEDGLWVPGKDRSSYILKDRLMLLRGFWTVGEDWVPRPIRAHLTVYYPDGTIHEDDQTITIEADSYEGDLKRTFYFGLMPEQVVPEIRFEMDLWETQPGYEGTPEPDPAPRLPYDGDAAVGVEKSDQLLKVVLVPINYNDGEGCNTTPDTSEKTMQQFYDYMYMMQPIDTLEITMHEPIDWNTKLSDFNETNEVMSGMRFDEGAPPEVFYFGLIDTCSGGVGGAGGKAYGIPAIPPRENQAYQRVSSGLSLPNNVDFSADTFVHEVGHSTGRYHIDCGGAAGFDPSYPYPNGEVAEWGFGVIDYGLRHPTVSKDYMTYCHPVWVGNWAWSKMFPVIKTLTEWSNAAPPAPDEDVYTGSLLVGSLYPDGHSTWITVPGGIEDDELSATDTIEFSAGGEVLAARPAKVQVLPDGLVTQVVVELPEKFDAVTSIEHIGPKLRHAASIDAIGIHHTSRAIKSNSSNSSN